MNSERLHALSQVVRDDIAKHKVVQLFKSLAAALQNLINQPNQPPHQDAFGEARQRLERALAQSETNSFSPTWRELLVETGMWDLTGNRLSARIDAIFASNKITQAAGVKHIAALQAEVENLANSLSNLLGAFSRFSIGKNDLAAGECEIGILIPRPFVRSQLEALGHELESLSKIFGVFQELAEGGRQGFKVRTISTSDFLVFLEAHQATCACIAIAIERIVALYKQLLEIKELRSKLKAQGVKEAALAGVSEHAEALMERGVTETASKMMGEYGRDDSSGRNHELEIELKFSLKRIASRIDRGFNFEVRIGPPVTDEVPGSDQAKQRATIDSATSTLQFLKLEGEPILNLEEGRPPDDVQ